MRQIPFPVDRRTIGIHIARGADKMFAARIDVPGRIVSVREDATKRGHAFRGSVEAVIGFIGTCS